jgi:hypothetical protein
MVLDEYARDLGRTSSDYHLQGWYSEDWGRVVIAFACDAFNDKPVRPFLDEIRPRMVREFGEDVGRQLAVVLYGYCGPGTEPDLPGFSATMLDVTEYLVPEPRTLTGVSGSSRRVQELPRP